MPARKSNEKRTVSENTALAAIHVITQLLLPSERLSVELLIREIEALFLCLILPLSADSIKRQYLLQVCVHLLKSLTREVWMNYIRTTYANVEIYKNSKGKMILRRSERYIALSKFRYIRFLTRYCSQSGHNNVF